MAPPSIRLGDPLTFTFDVSTNAGKVRLLIADTDSEHAIFQDDEIDAFLSLENGSIRLAAAQAIDTIATSEALILKVIRALDLQTDGAKLAEALFKRGRELRAQEESSLADPAGSWAIAEQVWNPWTFEERVINEALREGA